MPLVGVRPEVVAEAEHAFGNLFHRLHYFAQKLQAKGVDGAAALEGTIAELEEVLRLVLDYTSPLVVEVRTVTASTVLGSLASALRVQRGPALKNADGVSVLIDANHLSEAFRLMGQALGGEGSSIAAETLVDGDGCGWLQAQGLAPGRSGIASGKGLVAWAQAQKLVEAQGGVLVGDEEKGGVRWSVRLPLPSAGCP